jgi:Kdo2-lipid IVA lauroyltransferase/acyltransferase
MAKDKPRRVALYLLVRVVCFFIYLLPLRVGLKIGQYIGLLAFRVLKKTRETALRNLDIAFGDRKSLKEKKLTVQKIFENLGKNFVEVISLPKFNKYNIDKYVICNNMKIAESVVRDGKGAIVLSAHLGNWELLAHYFAIKGFSVNVIARRVRMEYFERFLSGLRKRNKVNVLYRDASAKEVVTLLKKNEIVGIMPDQDIDSVSGVFVNFFGKPAYTPTGPAVLNLLTGSPVVPCFIVRKGRGHEIMLENPLELDTDGDRLRNIKVNTEKCAKIIEKYIRDFPDQWVWFHERWKTRP